ncbi:hypothetical protein DL98DRAFT_240172 [Cadophora sp. DSE1049]|nr:hypothetical protein DL98DRAFT_240172 [Cadophora sp. DSE1049]
MNANFPSALGKLITILSVPSYGGDDSTTHQILMGRPIDPVDVGTLSVFETRLLALKESDQAVHHAHQSWQAALTLNKQQLKGIKSAIHERVTYIQGGPNTEAAVVCSTIALWAASLGFRVLITSPSNDTSKSNAVNLVEYCTTLPKLMSDAFTVVYFSCWTESLELIYESVGYKSRASSQRSDASLQGIQIWTLMVKYAEEHLAANRRDYASRVFLQTYDEMKVAATSGEILSKATLREFAINFKQLCATFLHHHKTGLIVISTCYNSAILHKSRVPFNLLVVDEAGRLAESDLIFVLQIPHDSLVQIGDRFGAQPTVKSKGSNDMYENCSRPNFRRMLQHSHQEWIELPNVR